MTFEDRKTSILLKQKSCVIYVDQEEAFDRIRRKVLDLEMRMRGIPCVLSRSVMSLYEGRRLESRLIMSCQRSLWPMCGCTRDLFCHLFILHLWWMLSMYLPDGIMMIKV